VSEDHGKARRPRRTRQHVIASLSRNFVERFILENGHTAERRIDDYGYDLFVETFDENGYLENGEIRVQLKATEKLAELRRGDRIAVVIDARHHELWNNELMPVFLILYDAREKKAYWLDVQRDSSADPSRRPKQGAKTFRVHIPLTNEFSETTVDYMRDRKAKIFAREETTERSHG
jgi:Domain of unknown function (DUF4365)